MQFSQTVLPLALFASFVAASPIPSQAGSSLTLERAHVDDLVLGESAFERRSPRFMPPGHGPGPVVQPSLKNAIVASAKAFVNLLSRVKKLLALQARGLEFSARDLSDLEDQLRLLVARAQADSDFDLLG